MAGLVLELQTDALNSRIDISELLRKALVVARKLGIEDFEEWVLFELNGYPADVEIPEYREFHGQVKVQNPFHGWQIVHFEHPEVAKEISYRKTNQPISELASLLGKPNNEMTIVMPFSEETARKFMENLSGPPSWPALHISPNQIHGVIDKVRNIVLNWSLELEQRGILGEGMTFSMEEKDAASLVTQITNIIGSMSNSSIMQSSPGAVQFTQIVIEKPSRDDLTEFASKLEDLIGQMAELQKEALADDLNKLKLRLDTIRLYLSSEQEDPGFVEESLKMTQGVLEGIVGGSIVTVALAPEVHQLAGQLLHQLGLWLG